MIIKQQGRDMGITYAELNVCGKKLDSLLFKVIAEDVGRLDDTLFAIQSLENAICESRASHCHRESS